LDEIRRLVFHAFLLRVKRKDTLLLLIVKRRVGSRPLQGNSFKG
jgi:hypothetical protein